MNQQQFKITYIIDGLTIGGAEKVVFDLASYMHEQGHDVEVVSLLRLPLEQQPFAMELQQQGISVISIEKKKKIDFSLQSRLVDYLHTRQPDIVHTHLWASDTFGLQAVEQVNSEYRNSNQREIVALSTEHSVNEHEGWLKHVLKRRSYTTADRVIAISSTVKSYVEHVHRVPAQKTVTISNGIDIEQFAEAHVQKRNQKTLHIAVIGRLSHEKGQDLFIESLQYVTQDYHARIVGSGHQLVEYERMVDLHNLSRKVSFVPAHIGIDTEYALADIIVVPSRFEGLGLVVMEAMAAGKAIIANNIPAFQELLEHNITGVLVNMEDASLLAATIDELLRDSDKREALGKQAQSEAQTFSIASMYSSYEEVYEQMLNKKSKAVVN